MSLFTEMYMRRNNSLSPEREYNKRNRFLNELHVNGEDVTDDDDFSIEDEDNDNMDTDSNPSNQAQDAADNPESDEQDTAPMTDPDNNVEDEDDFTLQDDDTEEPEEGTDDQPTETTEEVETSDENTDDAPVTDEANVNADEEDDFTIQDDDGAEDQDQPDEGGEEEPTDDTGDASGEDQEDDFTMSDDSGDAPAEGDGSDQDQEGGDNQQDNSGDQAPADPSDNISDEDIKTSEEQMYDSLTDDQKRIRTLSLKMEFKDLYESILGVIDGINGIPKSLDNIDSIKRVTNYVTKAKNILIDYIQNNFDKNPYLENYTIYIKFMAIFRTVGNVINDLNAQAGKSTDLNSDSNKK